MTDRLQPDASGHQASLSIQLADDGVSIDQDLTCHACHYNLRMQPRSGKCPECAASIETTIAKRMLVLLNPRWLKSISAGAVCLSYGIPTVLFVILIGNAVLKMLSVMLDARTVLMIGVTCIASVSLIGIWLFTTPLKTELASARLLRAQWIARLATIGLLGAIIGMFNIPNSVDPMPVLIIVGSAALTLIVSAVSFALCCGLIAQMLSDHKTRRRCLIYGALFGLGWLMTIPAMRSEFYGMRPAPLFIGFCFCGFAIIILIGFLILVLPNHLSKKLQAARSEASEILTAPPPVPTQIADPAV